MSGTRKHPLYGSKLILGEQVSGKHILRELDGDLPYILGPAIAPLSHMRKVLAADKNQFVITDIFDTVPDDPAYTATVLDEVQLKLLVLVQRICEFSLMTLDDMKTILL